MISTEEFSDLNSENRDRETFAEYIETLTMEYSKLRQKNWIPQNKYESDILQRLIKGDFNQLDLIAICLSYPENTTYLQILLDIPHDLRVAIDKYLRNNDLEFSDVSLTLLRDTKIEEYDPDFLQRFFA